MYKHGENEGSLRRGQLLVLFIGVLSAGSHVPYIYIYIFYFPWGGTGDVELLIKGIERHFVERLHALSRRDINPRVNRLLLAVDILPSRIRRYCLPGGVFHRIVSIYFIAVEMERRSFVSSFNLDSMELFYSLFFICSIFFDEQ